MKANVLQSMIALNAARISFIHCTIEDHLFQATYDRLQGEDAFAADEHRQVSRERSKLRKAVELQREMKAELAGIHREGRIARKIALVSECVDLTGIDKLTSYEQEEALDKLVAMFVPKKPDSRIKPEAKAA